MRLDRPHAGLLVIDDLFTKDECHKIIGVAQRAGFAEQRFGVRVGADLPPETRHRVEVHDVSIAEMLWSRVAPTLAPLPAWFAGDAPDPDAAPIQAWHAVGCNPRSRFYRYEMGDRFSPHFDLAWEPNPTTRTFLTILVFLNEDYVGGGTSIQGEVVQPITGRAVIFDHRLRHEGLTIERGTKTIWRSDVVYTCEPPEETTGGDDEAGATTRSRTDRLLDAQGNPDPALMAELQSLASGGAAPTVVAGRLLEEVGDGIMLFFLFLRKAFDLPVRELHEIEGWYRLGRSNTMTDAEFNDELAPWINDRGGPA